MERFSSVLKLKEREILVIRHGALVQTLSSLKLDRIELTGLLYHVHGTFGHVAMFFEKEVIVSADECIQ